MEPKRYSVIYADPPWKYSNEQDSSPARGAATYEKMELSEIKALPIRELAAKDCAVFMWATFPKLKEALEVLDSWGMTYITTAFVWTKMNPKATLVTLPGLCVPRFGYGRVKWVFEKVKTLVIMGGLKSGTGYWTNSNVEICLLAKRGAPKRIRKDVKQVVIAPVGRHSAKPDEVRKRIVDLMGDVPRVELFARELAPGWDSWGNEVESTIDLHAYDPAVIAGQVTIDDCIREAA